MVAIVREIGKVANKALTYWTECLAFLYENS